MKVKYPESFTYYDIEVSDSPMQNLIPFFPTGKYFIQQALDQGGKILVYCNNGLSRSPAFVVAYIMEANQWDFNRAFTHVQNRRFCMNPLEGFKLQLKEYEPIFQARDYIASVDYTPEQILMQGSRRRQLEED
ncbi:hypothetical protein HDU76_009289 [Blyttiomyces sp. JEL0837]|nr:hypothetical protein HDU76_009289 [Blyttiomyces sp. JEL0837]